MTQRNEAVDSPAQAEMTELVLPQHTNTYGNLLGGVLIHWMDMVAAMAAKRHCRRPAMTVSIDHVHFLKPVSVGKYIKLKASLNRAFRSSMEIGVKCFATDLYTGQEQHVCSGYFTFVALDENKEPVKVPEFHPETEIEKRRWAEAGKRRELRQSQSN